MLLGNNVASLKRDLVAMLWQVSVHVVIMLHIFNFKKIREMPLQQSVYAVPANISEFIKNCIYAGNGHLLKCANAVQKLVISSLAWRPI